MFAHAHCEIEENSGDEETRTGLAGNKKTRENKTKQKCKKNGSTERETQTRDGGREEETRGN